MFLTAKQLLEAKKQQEMLTKVGSGAIVAAKAFRDEGFKAISVVANGMEAVVVSRNAKIYILFQGTKDARDFLRDFEFEQEETYGGKVHKGFLEGWRLLNPGIHDAIETLDPLGDLPVAVSGHSLGAALATHTILDLGIQGYKLAESYTFGSPRVGNNSWAWYYNSLQLPMVRIANDNDIVTMVPFFNGYTHVKPVVYLSSTGETSNRRRLSLFLVIASWWVWVFAALKDHELVNYGKALEKAIEKAGWYGG